MALGRYDYERRYRRRFWARFAKFAFVIAVILSIGLFSYQMGIEQFKGRDASLRDEVALLGRQKTELELLASQMQHAARTAEARTAELEARLKREVPQGERAQLLALVAQRLEAGLDPKRLAFVIQQADSPRNCQQPETKRFALATPLARGGAKGVSFANGIVTVTGEGLSVRDAQGNPESWYDPAQPVTMRITTIAGKEAGVEGVLPLHKSIVHDAFEYRFTIAAGSRSFVEVTADRCPFP